MNFLQLYGDSPRFADWNAIYTHQQHAGYKREVYDTTNGCGTQFYVTPIVFKGEILPNINPTFAARIFESIGWLQAEYDKDGKRKSFTQVKAGKGRHYVFLGIEPPESE